MESQDLQLSNETESSFHFHLKAELENEEEELEDHFSEKAPAFLEIFSFHNSDIASIGTKSYTSNKYNFHAEIPLRILHQVFLI
ncbi:MAG: hypothetical protein KDC82_05790 [Bacteroidetes bacterium]|nr:hypothetical protein [Bacteroidota bacterium]